MDYPPRVYHFDLHTVGLAVGLLLVVAHGVALARPRQSQRWLQKLPRSRVAGIPLIVVAGIWSFWLASNLDLGEFSGYRRLILMAVPVLTALTAQYVQDLLTARALGILALLAAEPVLSAAFLHRESARLLLVILAYTWIVAGMFWVGKPYLLRDQISWLTKTPPRYRIAMLAGVIFGLVILVCTFTEF
jgi:hypothetical protein